MGDFTQAFYTIPQVAELLQVHENTIYRLVRAKKIEHYRSVRRSGSVRQSWKS